MTSSDHGPFPLPPELARSAALRHFEPNQDLFSQGEEAREIFALLSGSVKAWRVTEEGSASTVLLLGVGEIVGTVAMVQGTRHPVSITALDHVSALAWRTPLFREALAHDRPLTDYLLRMIVRRSEKLVDRLDDVIGLPVEVRLARLLLRRVGSMAVGEAGCDLALDLRQKDLAEMCATTVPTVSRTIAAWKKGGLVVGARGRLRISDVPRLADVGRLPLD